MSDLPQDGPGADLKSAREGMDVSTREVADALNLPVHVIEALEADDYERLPPTVFTRGYLRSYARLLELSPDGLLARYPEVTEETDVITGELPVAEPVTGAPGKTLGIAAAVGVVLIALLVFLLGDDEEGPVPEVPVETLAEQAEQLEQAEQVEEQVEQTEQQVEPAVQEGTQLATAAARAAEPEEAEELLTAPAEGDPAADRMAEAATAEPAAERQTTTAVVEDLAQAAEPAARAEPTARAEPSEPDADPTTDSAASLVEAAPGPVTPSFRERRITEFGEDEITFVFSEDCWVEVKSVDGENLYSDLNRTGRTLVLTGRAPFRILLGYAPGVTLSFNGEPVPLERYSRNNVANLVLGE